MSLLGRIQTALSGLVTTAGEKWHDSIEPWLSNFLSSVAHAEVNKAMATAEAVVEQAAPAFAKAIQSGDLTGFADAQKNVFIATGKQMLKDAEGIALTSVSTAVNMAVVAHPAVQAANAAVAPATDASTSTTETKTE